MQKKENVNGHGVTNMACGKKHSGKKMTKGKSTKGWKK